MKKQDIHNTMNKWYMNLILARVRFGRIVLAGYITTLWVHITQLAELAKNLKKVITRKVYDVCCIQLKKIIFMKKKYLGIICNASSVCKFWLCSIDSRVYIIIKTEGKNIFIWWYDNKYKMLLNNFCWPKSTHSSIVSI